MKRQYRKKYLVWLFPALVAGMIFLFSSQHAEESSHLSNIFVQILLQVREKLGVFPQVTDVSLLHLFSTLVRKGAHVTEYIILCISFSDRVLGIRDSWKRAQYRIFVLTFGYACTDEFHQLFVPGRAGRFTDVLIDSSGALVLSLIVVLVMHSRTMRGKRVRRRKSK